MPKCRGIPEGMEGELCPIALNRPNTTAQMYLFFNIPSFPYFQLLSVPVTRARTTQMTKTHREFSECIAALPNVGLRPRTVGYRELPNSAVKIARKHQRPYMSARGVS